MSRDAESPVKSRRSAFLCLGLVSAAAFLFPSIGLGEARTRILLLNSYHKGYEWSDAIVAAAERVLAEGIHDLELSVEYMDTGRSPGPRRLALLPKMLRLRYEGVKLDAIVCSDNNALTFLLKHHRDLFAGTPVVFCGINALQDPWLSGRTHFTGLVESVDVRATLDLMLRLHPGSRRVVVVSDGSRLGQGQRSLVAKLAGDYPGLAFEYLNGEDLTTEEMLLRVGASSSDSVVLLSHWRRGKDGAYRPSKRLYPKISSTSPVPVYGLEDTWLGLGIVGGKLNSGRLQGERAAEIALRIVRDGVRPADIPVQKESPNRYMFDHRQMRRFGIPESDLPAGSIVVHRPVSFYRRHTRLVWEVAGVFTILVLALIVLSLSIVRRRRAERGLRSLFEGMPDAVFVHDMDGRFLHCNEVACRRLGYSREELLALTTRDIDAPGFAEGFEDRLRRQREERRLGCEGAHVTKDGRRIPVDINTSHIRYRGRQAVLAVCRDATERRKAAEERERLEAQIQHTQKLESLGVLAGGIAHDFNNLLVAILGNADLALQDLAADAPARGEVAEIRKAAIRAAELTNQMLAYSGRGPSVVEALDLNELVEEMGNLLQVSISKKIVLEYHLAEGIPSIQADAAQIRQVVMNLITNASEAIGDRSGTIAVRTEVREVDREHLAETYLDEDLPGGSYTCLEVADTGCGMDEQTRANLFDPFFTTKFAGRGLGLAAVLGIVRGHGGAIQCRSEVGKGTTFKVLLPCSRAERAAAPSEVPGAEGQWRGAGTILVVDDERSVRDVAKMMLERHGFDVLTARDGQEGLDVFRRHAADLSLVLLDMAMPRMGGEEAFGRMRRLRAEVPVVLVSGYHEEDATGRFAGEGLAGFLQKPFQFDVLVRKVREVLDRRPGDGTGSS